MIATVLGNTTFNVVIVLKLVSITANFRWVNNKEPTPLCINIPLGRH